MAVENGHGSELDMVVDEDNLDTGADIKKEVENAKENEPEQIDKQEEAEDDDDDEEDEKEEAAEVEDNTTIKIEPTKDEEATVVMEVDEVQENDPLADTVNDEKIITPRTKIEETAAPPDPLGTEFVKDYAGGSGKNASGKSNIDTSAKKSTPITNLPIKIKVKEEPSEVVLIDSEDEKEEKPKVKAASAVVTATASTRGGTSNNNNNNMNLRQNPKVNFNKSHPSNTRGSGDFQIVSVDDDSPMNKNDPMNVFLCSTEEREFRKDYFKDPSSNVLKQRLHCTICDIHIGACPQNSKNMVCHRFLKVLICRKCANFYGQGEFPQDEGSDEFCRWCGEGGEVFLCNTCSNVFCQACILRNFGMQEIKRVDQLDNWDCYVCDPRPLWTLRAIAFALFTYVRRIKVVAYRNGMYQTISSANTKVSKSDLMALETDLSTCCPKEVKAAAAAASAPPPTELNNASPPNQAPAPLSSLGLKAKEKTPTTPVLPPRAVQLNNKVQSPTTTSPPVYPSSSKRGGKAQQWSHDQMGSKYLPGPGKKVPFLRSALTGAPPQPNIPYASSGPNQAVVKKPLSGEQSENSVLQWFNSVLSSMMDTMKNIENRLVFISNSTTHLISQNEVSFLVNQLHNLLKVSSSKMQEVDCDLLKNYKEFIDKSEITVNDFDDIVREFPEFFKPPENTKEPDVALEVEPEIPDDINPMALVEVIEEGDQPSQSLSHDGRWKQMAAKKAVPDSASDKNKRGSFNTKSNKKEVSTIPCIVTIKKEVTTDETSDATVGSSNNSDGYNCKSKNGGDGKRKLEVKENQNGVKKQKWDNVTIKQEQEDDYSETEQQNVKKCTVKLSKC